MNGVSISCFASGHLIPWLNKGIREQFEELFRRVRVVTPGGVSES